MCVQKGECVLTIKREENDIFCAKETYCEKVGYSKEISYHML